MKRRTFGAALAAAVLLVLLGLPGLAQPGHNAADHPLFGAVLVAIADSTDYLDSLGHEILDNVSAVFASVGNVSEQVDVLDQDVAQGFSDVGQQMANVEQSTAAGIQAILTELETVPRMELYHGTEEVVGEDSGSYEAVAQDYGEIRSVTLTIDYVGLGGNEKIYVNTQLPEGPPLQLDLITGSASNSSPKSGVVSYTFNASRWSIWTSNYGGMFDGWPLSNGFEIEVAATSMYLP
jgi:hypothetical protein